MFLSNPAKYFLICILILPQFCGCRFWQNNANTGTPLASEPKSNIPFSTKEPEVFQGEFVTTNGEISTSSFYARKGDKWRFDLPGGENSSSILKTDKVYSISHRGKVYAEMPAGQNTSTAPDFVNDLTFGLINGTEYTKFEEIGREGSVVKYKARIGDSSSSEALIYFDESAGMIVKQEFRSIGGQHENGSKLEYTFEIKNLKLEVNDSVFDIPVGYRKVSRDEYSSLLKHK